MANKGLVCAARCCALKKDLINETYSVTLNLRVTGGDGASIAGGTNVSFNNLSDEGFREFKRILGVDVINEDTPFIVQVLCPAGKEDQAFVQMSLAEGDKKLDGRQKKIAEPPKEPEVPAPAELPPLDETVAAVLDDPKQMKDLARESAKAVAGAKTEEDAVAAVAKVAEDAMRKKGAEIVANKPRGSDAIDDMAKLPDPAKIRAQLDAEQRKLGEQADRDLAAAGGPAKPIKRRGKDAEKVK